MLFSQDNLIIPLCSVNTPIATTGVEFDSFHMKGYDHATLIFQFGAAIFASTAILSIECGSADTGDSAGLSFHYRTNAGSAGGSASNDVWSAIASASAITLLEATYGGHTVIVEFDAGDLPVASKTYEWVTATIDTAASVGTVGAYAILSRPRYSKDIMPQALV